MKIVMKDLRAKPFEVKKSIKKLDRTYDMQLKIATIKDSDDQEEVDTENMTPEQIEELETKQNVESIERQRSLSYVFVDYVSDMLKLTEKEKDKLTDLEFEDVIDKALYISMRMTGMSDADIQKAREEDEESEEEGLE